MAIYQHIRRAYQPYGKQGTWYPSEDNDLIKPVPFFFFVNLNSEDPTVLSLNMVSTGRQFAPLLVGASWTVGTVTGIISSIATRNLKVSSNKCKARITRSIISGRWTAEEEEELSRIVMELKNEQSQDFDAAISWTEVSKRMNYTRGRQQCSAKW
jgi:Myb-like DNA-binding domain